MGNDPAVILKFCNRMSPSTSEGQTYYLPVLIILTEIGDASGNTATDLPDAT